MNDDLKRDYRLLAERLEAAGELLGEILERHGEHPEGLSPLACSPMWGQVAGALECLRHAQNDLIEQRDAMMGTSTIKHTMGNRANGRKRV